MRFRLLYEGELLSSQSAHKNGGEKHVDHKHRIRKQFHRQLKNAFNSHPVLSGFKYCTACKKNHALEPPDRHQHKLQSLQQFITTDVGELHGYNFCPLVSNGLDLHCSLEILILRRGQDATSGLYSSGDLDNRVKTLIDGLTMPTNREQLGQYTAPDQDESPFFVLMKNDNIVSGLKVEADVLHRDEDNCGNKLSDSYVYAVINAEIKPGRPNHLNLNFF